MKAEYVDHLGSDLTVVNAARTKTQEAILVAVERGYYMFEGRVIGPKGPRKLSLYGNQRYPAFAITINTTVRSIPAHMFAARCYYGHKAFEKDVVVRHLDGDTLNISIQNIALGSHSDNNLDKDPSVRKRAARIARASQGKTPCNARLTLADVAAIKEARRSIGEKKAPNGFMKDLAKKYGVSRTVIHNVIKEKSYAS